MRSMRFCASPALLLCLGCAGSGHPSTDARPVETSSAAESARVSSEVVTRAELDASPLGDVDALTIIKQLRPRYLSYRGLASTSDPRGGGIQVSINQGRLTGTEVLTSIRKDEIDEIRYLNAAAAAQRFGSLSRAGPVILLRRR